MKFFKVSFFVLSFILCLISHSFAGKIDDRFVCSNLTKKIEREEKIKKHLLTTISNVETGRWDSELKKRTTWPWTINANGKSIYAKNKAEAILEVENLQKQGIRSIDVGCMQINLSFHGEAFENLEDALDPKNNIKYGAKFLKKLYKDSGDDWEQASTHYHSKNPEKGEKYKEKLQATYKELTKNKNKSHKMLATKIVEDKNLKNDLALKARRMHEAGAWRNEKMKIYRANKKIAKL